MQHDDLAFFGQNKRSLTAVWVGCSKRIRQRYEIKQLTEKVNIVWLEKMKIELGQIEQNDDTNLGF